MPTVDREAVLTEIQIKKFQIKHSTDEDKKRVLQAELAELERLLILIDNANDAR